MPTPQDLMLDMMHAHAALKPHLTVWGILYKNGQSWRAGCNRKTKADQICNAALEEGHRVYVWQPFEVKL